MFYRSILFLPLFLLSVLAEIQAKDVPSMVYIEKIDLMGNKKTKERVILRELTFREGDTIPAQELMEELQLSRLHVYNLGLFKEVNINVSAWVEDRVTISIEMMERWYYIPLPIFKLTDRNFNVWWVDYDHDFTRTIYGLSYSQSNVTGNNDLLRIAFFTGYSQAISAMYNFPHINKKQTLGIEGFFRYDRNKSFEYMTQDNKHIFFNSDNFIRNSFHGGIVLKYRKEVYDVHYFGLFYRNTSISDTIIELNPKYYLHDGLKQNFFQFNYRFESDHRNIKAYPTKGYQWSIEAEKVGLGIFNDVDFFNIYGSYSRFFNMGKGFYASALLKGKISAPDRQPFFNQRGLGYYQDFVRGYEYFVIDGQEYVFSRMNLKYNFLNFSLKNKLMKKSLGSIPFQFFLKTYVDLGYVNDKFYYKNNPLNNYLLVGAGLGLDIVTLYDNIFRVEYTLSRVNGLNGKKLQNGLYLHFVIDINDDMRSLKRARYLDPK